MGGSFGNFYDKAKPYIAMISLQIGYAGMDILSKLSLNRGMSHYVLVVYRQIFATAVIAPFALIFERKVWPKVTFTIFMQLFVLGLLGPVIDANSYYAGLKLTSPTFASAMNNMLPPMTFVMAVICRMEIVDMKKVRSLAKVVGTIVTVGGAMLMTLYKGQMINMFWSDHIHPIQSDVPVPNQDADKDWVKGSIFLIIGNFAWASFFILQATFLDRWLGHESVSCCIFCIAYYVQGIVMEKRGPVFVSAFSPLMMVIVAIMGSFILAEKIYVGEVLGSGVIVVGLYAVLWGEYKEFKEKEEAGEILEQPMKDYTQNETTKIQDIY